MVDGLGGIHPVSVNGKPFLKIDVQISLLQNPRDFQNLIDSNAHFQFFIKIQNQSAIFHFRML